MLEGGYLISFVIFSEILWVDGVIKQIVQDVGLKVKLWIGGSDCKIYDVWDFVDG